jgi:hypothetical protein
MEFFEPVWRRRSGYLSGLDAEDVRRPAESRLNRSRRDGIRGHMFSCRMLHSC